MITCRLINIDYNELIAKIKVHAQCLLICVHFTLFTKQEKNPTNFDYLVVTSSAELQVLRS